MSCFSCFSSRERRASKKYNNKNERLLPAAPYKHPAPPPHSAGNGRSKPPLAAAAAAPGTDQDVARDAENKNIQARVFTFRELAAATKNFRQECLLGEGGFGRVYRGKIDETDQVVAVKQLDRNGLQGNREFLVEVLMLSLLHHPNLVSLIGYCADGDQRLLVYEFMALGALEDHLLDLRPGKKGLDWFKRMKIALGAARGLEYLHVKAKPPVIYRDLKSSNILLDGDFNAKLSDFGLAKLGPDGDDLHVSSRVMGTYGYCAPEYQRTGHLTLKSDVYSFGVVLLELITGRRVVDPGRPHRDQNLVTWALPLCKQRRFPELADPSLGERLPAGGLKEAVAVATMCLQEEAAARPIMTDVVNLLASLCVESQPEPEPEQEPEPAATGGRAVLPSPASPERAAKGVASFGEPGGSERQRAVAEAIEWGSTSRHGHLRRSRGASTSSF